MPVFNSACSFLLGTLLSHAAWAAPTQRILLLEDRAQTSHEQTVVREAMMAELFADPDVQLLAPGVLPARMTRGAELRRVGCEELKAARRALARSRLGEAQNVANRAVQKLWRAASLTGEVAPWLEARAVQGAVQAAQGRGATAQRLFAEVFAMDTAFDDAALRRVASRAAVTRARTAVAGAPTVALRVRAVPSESAIWVDGRFEGYAEATVHVVAKSQHVVLATAPGHEPRAQVVTAASTPARQRAQGAQRSDVAAALRAQEPELALHLVAHPTNATVAYDELVASTRIAKSFPDPNNPLFDALDPTAVWVLRYAQGGVHLAAFDLTTGRRHDGQASAVIFSLSDARHVARALAVQPPAVPALERPPTT